MGYPYIRAVPFYGGAVMKPISLQVKKIPQDENGRSYAVKGSESGVILAKFFHRTDAFEFAQHVVKFSLIFLICTLILGGISEAKIRPFIGIGSGKAYENDNIRASFSSKAEAGIRANLWRASFSLASIRGVNTMSFFQQGEIRINPVMFNACVQAPVTKRLTFYGGGGISYVLADHILDEKLAESLDRMADKHRESIKAGWGNQAVIGTEYFFSKNFAFGFEANYLFFKPIANITDEIVAPHSNSNKVSYITSVQEKTLSLDTLMIFMTARYYF
jgi:hypothetical protein